MICYISLALSQLRGWGGWASGEIGVEVGGLGGAPSVLVLSPI